MKTTTFQMDKLTSDEWRAAFFIGHEIFAKSHTDRDIDLEEILLVGVRRMEKLGYEFKHYGKLDGFSLDHTITILRVASGNYDHKDEGEKFFQWASVYLPQFDLTYSKDFVKAYRPDTLSP